MQALLIRRACSYWERLVSIPPELLRTARSTASIPFRTHSRTLAHYATKERFGCMKAAGIP